MPIPINSGNGETRKPYLSLVEQGQYIDFAVVNEQLADAYVFGTTEIARKPDGTKKTKDVLTVVVVQGTGVIIEDKIERPVQAGDVATIHIESYMRWDPDSDKAKPKGEFKSWSGAKEDLGQLEVGTVGRWYFEGEVPGKGAIPRKFRLFKLRQPRTDELQRTQRCEQLYRDGTAVVLSGAVGADEAPF